MKKAFLSISLLILAISFVKCGPASEDRNKMYENANHVSDSIGKAIDAALAQGAIPNSTLAPAVSDTAKPAVK